MSSTSGGVERKTEEAEERGDIYSPSRAGRGRDSRGIRPGLDGIIRSRRRRRRRRWRIRGRREGTESPPTFFSLFQLRLRRFSAYTYFLSFFPGKFTN